MATPEPSEQPPLETTPPPAETTAPPAETVPPPRASKRWIAGTVLMIVALVFLIIAMLLPWWVYSIDISADILGVTMEGTVSAEFKLSEVSIEGDMVGVSVSDTTSYDELGETDLKAVYDNTYLLLIVSIVLVVVALVVGILAGFRVVPGIAAVAVGVVAAILILVTVLYFFAALPPVLDSSSAAIPDTTEAPIAEGFFGSESIEVLGASMGASWGPGLSWFIAIVAFVLGLVGSFMFFGMKRTVSAVA